MPNKFDANDIEVSLGNFKAAFGALRGVLLGIKFEKPKKDGGDIKAVVEYFLPTVLGKLDFENSPSAEHMIDKALKSADFLTIPYLAKAAFSLGLNFKALKKADSKLKNSEMSENNFIRPLVDATFGENDIQGFTNLLPVLLPVLLKFDELFEDENAVAFLTTDASVAKLVELLNMEQLPPGIAGPINNVMDNNIVGLFVSKVKLKKIKDNINKGVADYIKALRLVLTGTEDKATPEIVMQMLTKLGSKDNRDVIHKGLVAAAYNIVNARIEAIGYYELQTKLASAKTLPEKQQIIKAYKNNVDSKTNALIKDLGSLITANKTDQELIDFDKGWCEQEIRKGLNNQIIKAIEDLIYQRIESLLGDNPSDDKCKKFIENKKTSFADLMALASENGIDFESKFKQILQNKLTGLMVDLAEKSSKAEVKEAAEEGDLVALQTHYEALNITLEDNTAKFNSKATSLGLSTTDVDNFKQLALEPTRKRITNAIVTKLNKENSKHKDDLNKYSKAKNESEEVAALLTYYNKIQVIPDEFNVATFVQKHNFAKPIKEQLDKAFLKELKEMMRSSLGDAYTNFMNQSNSATTNEEVMRILREYGEKFADIHEKYLELTQKLKLDDNKTVNSLRKRIKQSESFAKERTSENLLAILGRDIDKILAECKQQLARMGDEDFQAKVDALNVARYKIAMLRNKTFKLIDQVGSQKNYDCEAAYIPMLHEIFKISPEAKTESAASGRDSGGNTLPEELVDALSNAENAEYLMKALMPSDDFQDDESNDKDNADFYFIPEGFDLQSVNKAGVEVNQVVTETVTIPVTAAITNPENIETNVSASATNASTKPTTTMQTQSAASDENKIDTTTELGTIKTAYAAIEQIVSDYKAIEGTITAANLHEIQKQLISKTKSLHDNTIIVMGSISTLKNALQADKNAIAGRMSGLQAEIKTLTEEKQKIETGIENMSQLLGDKHQEHTRSIQKLTDEQKQVIIQLRNLKPPKANAFGFVSKKEQQLYETQKSQLQERLKQLETTIVNLEEHFENALGHYNKVIQDERMRAHEIEQKLAQHQAEMERLQARNAELDAKINDFDTHANEIKTKCAEQISQAKASSKIIDEEMHKIESKKQEVFTSRDHINVINEGDVEGADLPVDLITKDREGLSFDSEDETNSASKKDREDDIGDTSDDDENNDDDETLEKSPPSKTHEVSNEQSQQQATNFLTSLYTKALDAADKSSPFKTKEKKLLTNQLLKEKNQNVDVTSSKNKRDM